jgi:hypothetical protein
MKIRNEVKPRRILARMTALELSPEELAQVRGTTDNQDTGCGCGGGASCALVTTPNYTEDN